MPHLREYPTSPMIHGTASTEAAAGLSSADQWVIVLVPLMLEQRERPLGLVSRRFPRSRILDDSLRPQSADVEAEHDAARLDYFGG